MFLLTSNLTVVSKFKNFITCNNGPLDSFVTVTESSAVFSVQ